MSAALESTNLLDGPDSPPALIRARSLTKRFGATTAVDAIDFDVLPGECFGFLGPNGAGKSTTIRMLACSSPLTAGSLTVNGLDTNADQRRIKARLGVVPQDNNLDTDLTVIENLVVYARYFDIDSRTARERADELLDLFQLTDRAKAPVDSLSGGMQRRLIIARALINQPAVVILDEPTTGLDPQARHVVWRTLRLLRGRGTTMVLTTHYMDEAAQLCDRLVIMNQGSIVARGTPADLILRHAGRGVLQFETGVTEDEARSHLPTDGVAIETSGDTVYVYARNGEDLSRHLPGLGDRAIYRSATLEDVFLRLTGRALIED